MHCVITRKCNNFPLLLALVLTTMKTVTIVAANCDNQPIIRVPSMLPSSYKIETAAEVHNATAPDAIAATNGTSNMTTTTPTQSKEKILLRRRRYLTFPSGSSFQVGEYFVHHYWKCILKMTLLCRDVYVELSGNILHLWAGFLMGDEKVPVVLKLNESWCFESFTLR